LAEFFISNKGRIAHRAGWVRQFLKQPTRNSTRWFRVLTSATRIRLKPSFDRVVSGEDDRVSDEDDRVSGGLSDLGGSWIALVTFATFVVSELIGA